MALEKLVNGTRCYACIGLLLDDDSSGIVIMCDPCVLSFQFQKFPQVETAQKNCECKGIWLPWPPLPRAKVVAHYNSIDAVSASGGGTGDVVTLVAEKPEKPSPQRTHTATNCQPALAALWISKKSWFKHQIETND